MAKYCIWGIQKGKEKGGKAEEKELNVNETFVINGSATGRQPLELPQHQGDALKTQTGQC